MFQEMRKKEREISREEAFSILQKGEYGILSTLGENGYPYGVPVSFAAEDDKIYFHCAREAGQKLSNLRLCPRVSFTVVGPTKVLPEKFSTKYESAIAFGTVSEASDKQKGLTLLLHKYSPDFFKEGLAYIDRAIEQTGVYEISIKHLTGKARR